MLGQRPDHVDDPGQGGFEQRAVVLVGTGGEQVQGNALPVGGYRTFGALLAPVNRAAASDFASAGGLGDGAVHGEVVQVQADDLVVGRQGDPQDRGPVPGLGPLVHAAAQGAVRALLGRDPLYPADRKPESRPAKDEQAADPETLKLLARLEEKNKPYMK